MNIIDTAKATNNTTVTDDRLEQLSNLVFPNGSSKVDDLLFTVGFRIENVSGLIANSLADSRVLGWFLKFKKKVNNEDVNIALVRDIQLVALYLDGNLLETTMLSATIQPYVFHQVMDPGSDGREDTEEEAIPITQGDFTPFTNDLRTEDLTHYRPWAEAVFLRRSDLRFLQLYLDTFSDKYDDLFFSGGEVNYGIMHNPRLRRMQFSLPDGNGGVVPDSSKAFTLKVEPFPNRTLWAAARQSDRTDPEKEDQIEGIGQDDPNTGGSAPRAGTNGKPFPIAAIGIPCPDYWELTEELETVIQSNSSAAFARLHQTLELALRNNGIDGLSTNPIVLPDVANPGFFESLLTALINWLTSIRDGLKQ